MREYYLNQFETDLRTFLGDSAVPYFGHGWHYSCAEQLTQVIPEHRAQFLICLYFTVLADQAMYAHFIHRYSEFEKLTKYPKFCQGLSQFQLNPRGILLSPVKQQVLSSVELGRLLPEGMSLFVDEVIAFFRDHMPDLEPRAFFQKLLYDPDVQIPELLIMVDPSLKDDVVCIAYREMRRAVERALP
jgi:hypothetical protein